MRKALTVLMVVFVSVVGVPLFARATTGSVEGRVVDASGRAVTGQRIDLVRDSVVVNTSVTASTGQWLFKEVPAGDYVVRLNIRGTVAGIHVTVTPGASVNGRLIVTPASAAAPQLGAVAGFLASGASSAVVSAAAVAASAVTSTATSTNTVQADAVAITDVLKTLTPDQRKAFAEELKAAVTQPGDNPFASEEQKAQLVAALNFVIANPTVVPTFPANPS
jgi:hypothetical protein